MGYTTRLPLLIIVLLTIPFTLFPQVDPLELLRKFQEPEAPPAFMSMAINDTAVELFLQGSWKSYWGDYLGFGGINGAAVSMTGFAHTPWSNSVDFLLSLWIQRHYFFETNLSDGFNFRSFSLGYASIDGPGLNKLMVSNTGVDIPAYPYLTMGKAGNDVPGILAEWSTSLSHHYAMLRLLNRNTVTQYFQGTAAQITSKTATNSFIQGRFFQVPYTNLSAIYVWVQSSSGTLATDGNYYTLLGAKDILYMDLSRGTVGLLVAATTRVLIAWTTTSNSQPVDFPDLTGTGASTTIPKQLSLSSIPFNPTTGSSFKTNVSDFLASNFGYKPNGYVSSFPSLDSAGLVSRIDGFDAILAHSPGQFSIFQDYSWYLRPQGLTPTGVRLDGVDEASYNTAILADAIHLGHIGGSGFSVRYPLLANYVDGKRLYLPGYQAGSEQSLEWKGSGAQSTTGIVLDQDPLPESIIVTRNGMPETGFTWNASSRSLSFVVPVQANESITVTYDLASRIGGSRTIQFAQGNTWQPMDGVKVEAAFGLDWPIEQQATGSTGTDVGRLMTGSSLDFNLPDSKISGEVALGLSLNVPGAAGTRYLQDFSSGFLDIPFASGRQFPSAVPTGNGADLPTSTAGFFPSDISPAALPLISNLTRGELLFKNFSAGNGTMIPWNGSPQATFPYLTGNPTGPYLAGTATGDPFAGIVAVADIVIAPTKNWVSFEFRLTDDQRQALARTSTIWFYLKTDSLSNSVDLFLQSGRLAENIDGGSTIITGAPGSAGFLFNDQSNGQVMVAGSDFSNSVGNVLSEDSDGNGVLRTNDQNPYSKYIGLVGGVSAHPGWQLVRLSIDDLDRIKLQGGAALRLVALRNSGDVSGQILIGQIHLDLPGMGVSSTGTATVQASVDRDLAREISLETAFPEAIRATDTAAQGRIDWQAGSGTIQATQAVNANSYYDSRYIRVYLQPNLTASSETIQLIMDDGLAQKVSSPLISLSNSYNAQWLRAEFDMVNQIFTLIDRSGTVITRGSSIISGHPHQVEHISIAVINPSQPGTVYIDSMTASEGISSIQGDARGKVNWAHPESILATGDYTILSNIRTTQSAEYVGNTRLSNFSGLDTPVSNSVNYEGTLGATISYIDFLIGTRILGNQDGLSGQASYQLTIPSGIASPIVLKDSFSSDIGVALPFVQKQTSLTVSVPGIADAQSETSISQSYDLLQQNWSASLGLGNSASVHGETKVLLSQTSQNTINQGLWNSTSLSQKLGSAYQWYLPGSEVGRLQRNFTWNLGGTIESPDAGLGLSALFTTLQDPTAIYTFSTGLDLKTTLRVGEQKNGIVATFTYLRHSTLQDNFSSHNFSDEFTQGFSMIGQFAPAWKVIPFYELFDNGSSFIQASSPYQAALDRPQFGVGLTRPWDSTWTSLVLPKQVDAGIARLLERKGALINDRLIVYANLGWNSLNQFGRVGQKPTFLFYDTDQFDLHLSGAVLLHDAVTEEWQISPSITVALFGFAADPAKNEWRARSASSMGLIELAPPNQFRLGESFVYRSGENSLTANTVKLEYSWYSDFPNLTYNFMNKKSKDVTFLENTEAIELGTNYPSTAILATDSVGTNLNDLYSFPDISSTDTGMLLAIRHRSYLILPGLAYVSAQLSIGYHRDMVTQAGTVAVQLYVEARVIF